MYQRYAGSDMGRSVVEAERRNVSTHCVVGWQRVSVPIVRKRSSVMAALACALLKFLQ